MGHRARRRAPPHAEESGAAPRQPPRPISRTRYDPPISRRCRVSIERGQRPGIPRTGVATVKFHDAYDAYDASSYLFAHIARERKEIEQCVISFISVMPWTNCEARRQAESESGCPSWRARGGGGRDRR